MPKSDGGSLSAIIAAAHRFGLSTLIIKSADGTDLWSQFSQSLVSALHANGIHVCAWQYVYGNHPGHRGLQRRRRGPRRRRLPDHRRRVRVRGQVRLGPGLHPAAARAHRLQLPARPGRLPLHRLPPGLPLLGLPRPRRRPVQRPADVLARHRHHHRRRLRPHLRLQPHLPAPDLPAGPGLRPPAGPPGGPLPPARPRLRRRRPELVGLAGGRRLQRGSPCHGRPARCPATSPTSRWPTSARTPPATSSSGPRSTSSPPATPSTDLRRLRLPHPARRRGLPDRPRAHRRRHHRTRHLGRAAALPHRPGRRWTPRSPQPRDTATVTSASRHRRRVRRAAPTTLVDAPCSGESAIDSPLGATRSPARRRSRPHALTAGRRQRTSP